MSRFMLPLDCDMVLLGGPWVLDDAAQAAGPWASTFRPSPKSLTSGVIWLCLPDLPPILWIRGALELVVAWAGRLVKSDQATELLSKERFARVIMECHIPWSLALISMLKVRDP